MVARRNRYLPGHPDRRAGGFALAEVLMAAGILAVGLLGLAALQVASAAAAETARARRAAVALARNALEARLGGLGAGPPDAQAAERGPGRFTVTVAHLAPAGPAHRYRAEVTWPDGRSGRIRRVVLTRLEAP